MISDNSVLNSGSDHMIDVIDDVLSTSSSVDIIVSFLKESGLSLITDALVSALDRGVRIRILIGTYLGITSPFELEELMSLKDIQSITAMTLDNGPYTIDRTLVSTIVYDPLGLPECRHPVGSESEGRVRTR